MFSGNRDRQIEEELYKLKFRHKTLVKMAAGYKKRESEYYKKAKKSLVKGDERTATTYARQSVQFSDMALKTNNMACSVEVIESRVREAVQTGKLNDQMIQTVRLLTAQLAPTTTMTNMATLDKGFEDIMVTTEAIGNVLDGVAAPAIGYSQREQALLGMAQEEIALDDMSSLGASLGLPGNNMVNSLDNNKSVKNFF